MAAYAGLKSAALNVQINAGGLKDRVFAEAQLAELAGLLSVGEQATAKIYQIVKDKL